jgi:3-oxoacyl-[acyl-carrier protein] reductase
VQKRTNLARPSPVLDLTEKVCLVTGATGGIGVAIVEALARAGAHVVLHTVSQRARADELAAKVGLGRSSVVVADLEEPDAAATLFRQALALKGRIDVLVNNAAVMPAASPDDPLPHWHEAWDRTLRVNLVAAADLCREALLHWRSHPSARIIVNIASRAAFRGDTLEYMHYAASKAGLVALTRSIARGCGKDGVVAYAVAPGFVNAGMASDFIAQHGAEAIVRDIPLGEMAPPEEVANVVAFLASGLARHATGTTIDVNGASYVR